MSTTDVWMIVGIVVLLLVLMALAVAEMGLTRTSKVRANSLAESEGRRGAALVALVGRPERFVNPILLTVNICQTVQATFTGIVAANLFGVWGVVIGVSLNVVVFFVLAEAVPKTWAVLNPERAALASARPISALVRFWPLRVSSRGLIGLTNVIIKGKGLARGPFVTVSEQELLAMADVAVEEDVIEHEERKLIESVFEFGDTVAREIMVPRPDMITVAASATVTEALDIAIEHGFSRVPVMGESVDDVLGLAFTKDLVRAEREGRGAEPVAACVRPARFVPETKSVARLMREMQAAKQHMAMLVDEYGGIAGLVTLEDCLEELVGDIVDEYDAEEAEFERLPDGVLRVEGGLDVEELNELLGTELPDDDWDTVGGYLLGMLGHVPAEGEVVEAEGHRFTVERLDGRRIARVLVQAIDQ